MKKIYFLFLLLPFAAVAQQNYFSLLDDFMKAEAAINHFNGNVLVAKSGNIVFQKSFGHSNFHNKQPLNNQSVFELASVSKQFTAMGILLLVDKKKLTLQDSLRQYFPELPYQNITIEHLLTHTSGLPDYEAEMVSHWDHKKIAFNDDVIRFLAQRKPAIHFKPGAKWEYSNTAYALLASIIEKVSGQTFSAYLDANIFKPLGMKHSRVYNTRRSTGERIANYAYGYVYSDSLQRYILPDSLPAYNFVYYLDGIQGDGIVNSTTGDLLLWDRALKNGSLLNKPAMNSMLSSRAVVDTAGKRYYGYGVFLGTNEIGDYIFHTGGWPGYHTLLCRYLADDLTIIILSNNEANVTMVGGALAYIATGKEVVPPYKHQAITLDSGLLNRYIGNYLIPGVPLSRNMKLVEKEGKLYCQIGNAAKEIELTAESATKFFDDNGVDQQVEFELDGSGKVKKAWYIFKGMKKEIDKLD